MALTDDSLHFLSPNIKSTLAEMGIEQLTPIQKQAIPLLLTGKDFVGQSKTGSGKTWAFSIPILEKINLEKKFIQALILCPTRELCAQVAREIRKLGRRHTGLQVLVVSGGVPGRDQAFALRKGVHIVVGTPGRVLDHLERHNMDLNDVTTVVLDEADRMLDMGFQEDMESILRETPESRQTVFFSATYPPEIQHLSHIYQRNPESALIEDTEKTKPAIQQYFYTCDDEQKTEALLLLLRKTQPESALIFCNLKSTVAELAKLFERKNIPAASLHGDLEQRDRDRVMALFRNSSKRFLIATDVAARGLDIEDLQMVVNYDFPHQTDDYVHRIGRTGRAGKTGYAISFVNARERLRVSEFAEALGMEINRTDLESLKALNEKKELHNPANMQTLVISGGRKEKVRPGDILGALTGEAGLPATAVGKIEIHDHFAYVAISRDLATTALERLQSGKIKGKRFVIHLID